MTAGVSSMAWILGSRKEDSEPNHHPVTRDLLGSGSGRPHGTVGRSVTRSEQGLEFQGCSIPANHQLLDLNFPPTVQMDDHAATASSSMCTLEKVKLALERAEREAISKPKSEAETSKPSSSTTTSSLKRRAAMEEGPESSSAHGGGCGEMTAAVCTRCFMLVLVPKSEPRCPQCNSHVSLPTMKKPRVDLNTKLD